MILAAEQVVYRLPRRLARNVPERHIDSAQHRCGVQAGMPKIVARGVHPVPNPLNVESVFAHNIVAQHLIYEAYLRFQVAQTARIAAARDALAQPAYPLIGVDLQKQQVFAADIRRFVLHDHRFEVRNFHGKLPWISVKGGWRHYIPVPM